MCFAELLGLSGFLLASGRRTITSGIGAALLYLAVLTKQTALVYLVAAAIGLGLEGRPKQGAILSVVTGALLVTIAVVQFRFEPNLVACLLGESQMPVAFESWWRTVRTVSLADPEFYVLAIAGIIIWSRGPRKEPKLALLAVLLFVSSVVTAAKRGSAENYFLGIRSVAGFAAAALCHSLSKSAQRPKVWEVVALAGVAAGTGYGIYSSEFFWRNARREANQRATAWGRTGMHFYEGLLHDAQDPRRRLLTDVGIIDVRQGERTVFGDPYRFKLMSDTGLIDTRVIQTNIDNEYYDVIFCNRDLFSPGYDTYEFGLPRPLAERARKHYQPAGFQYGLYLYHRRGKQAE